MKLKRDSHNSSIYGELERLVAEDKGGRGIAPLAQAQSGGLAEIVNTLQNVQCVAICSGFFVPTCGACETDGPPGAVAIAEAHIRSRPDTSAVIITEILNLPVLQAAASALPDNVKQRLAFHEFPYKSAYEVNAAKANGSWDAYISSLWSGSATSLSTPIGCVISIERLGRAQDGSYYNMRAELMDDYNYPIDEIVIQAEQTKAVKTFGIGDGGNEIGMGNVFELVKQHVPRGGVIASVVRTGHLLVAGVSNWGGFAVALCLLSRSGVDLSEVEFVNQTKVMEAMLKQGAVDGSSRSPVLSVDGLPMETHQHVLRRIAALLEYPLP